MSKKTAWTEDGSDITAVAERVMLVVDQFYEGGGSADPKYAEAVKRIKDGIAPFVMDVTQTDVDILEDYNYHIGNTAIAQLRPGDFGAYDEMASVYKSAQEGSLIGETVITPSGEGKVIEEDGPHVVVEYPDGSRWGWSVEEITPVTSPFDEGESAWPWEQGKTSGYDFGQFDATLDGESAYINVYESDDAEYRYTAYLPGNPGATPSGYGDSVTGAIDDLVENFDGRLVVDMTDPKYAQSAPNIHYFNEPFEFDGDINNGEFYFTYDLGDGGLYTATVFGKNGDELASAKSRYFDQSVLDAYNKAVGKSAQNLTGDLLNEYISAGGVLVTRGQYMEHLQEMSPEMIGQQYGPDYQALSPKALTPEEVSTWPDELRGVDKLGQQSEPDVFYYEESEDFWESAAVYDGDLNGGEFFFICGLGDDGLYTARLFDSEGNELSSAQNSDSDQSVLDAYNKVAQAYESNDWAFMPGRDDDEDYPTCSVCDGEGTCSECNGSGCPACDDTGDCLTCDGEGLRLGQVGYADVYYTDDFWHEFDDGWRDNWRTEREHPTDYLYVGMVAESDKNAVYERMNIGDHGGYDARSMSEGDVVVIGGEAWLVKAFGWEDASDWFFDEKTAPYDNEVYDGRTAQAAPNDLAAMLAERGVSVVEWVGDKIVVPERYVDQVISLAYLAGYDAAHEGDSEGRSHAGESLASVMLKTAQADEYRGLTMQSPIEDVRRVLKEFFIEEGLTTVEEAAHALIFRAPFDDEVYESIANAGLDYTAVIEECLPSKTAQAGSLFNGDTVIDAEGNIGTVVEVNGDHAWVMDRDGDEDEKPVKELTRIAQTQGYRAVEEADGWVVYYGQIRIKGGLSQLDAEGLVHAMQTDLDSVSSEEFEAVNDKFAQLSAVCPSCGSQDTEEIEAQGEGEYLYACNDCGDEFFVAVDVPVAEDFVMDGSEEAALGLTAQVGTVGVQCPKCSSDATAWVDASDEEDFYVCDDCGEEFSVEVPSDEGW